MTVIIYEYSRINSSFIFLYNKENSIFNLYKKYINKTILMRSIKMIILKYEKQLY